MKHFHLQIHSTNQIIMTNSISQKYKILDQSLLEDLMLSSDYTITIKNTELIDNPSGDEQVNLIL